MPEGPEVKIVTEWLIKYCSGCTIKNNDKFPEINSYVIQRIECKGKHIFFHLFNTADQTRKVLESHLAMTGRWSHIQGNHTRFWMVLSNPIVLQDWILYFDDVRKWGRISLLSTDEFVNKIDQIGPDLLSDVINPGEWHRKIKNGRIKNKMICDYLLEQKHFSGIGNYLKSDILYLCKIKPDRPLCSLSDEEINCLLQVSVSTIKESYSYGGLTIKNFWDPEGKRGLYPTKVYNKVCDCNGYKIVKIKFKGNNDRTTHWVPEVQK